MKFLVVVFFVSSLYAQSVDERDPSPRFGSTYATLFTNPLVSYGYWESNLDIGLILSTEFSGTPLFRGQGSIKGLMETRFAWFGGELEYHSYLKGTLPGAIKKTAKHNPTGAVVGAFVVAIPFLKISLTYDDRVLPEYYWFQDNKKQYWHYRDLEQLKEWCGYGYETMRSEGCNYDERGIFTYDDQQELNSELNYNLSFYEHEMNRSEEVNWLLEEAIIEHENHIEDSFVNYYGSAISPFGIKVASKFGPLFFEFIFSGRYTSAIYHFFVENQFEYVLLEGGVYLYRHEGITQSTIHVGIGGPFIAIGAKGQKSLLVSPIKIEFSKSDSGFYLGYTGILRFGL
ncbi:MAG: hypothetical protein OCC49_14650 [Fibrobacterales bacterium]